MTPGERTRTLPPDRLITGFQRRPDHLWMIPIGLFSMVKPINEA